MSSEYIEKILPKLYTEHYEQIIYKPSVCLMYILPDDDNNTKQLPYFYNSDAYYNSAGLAQR